VRAPVAAGGPLLFAVLLAALPGAGCSGPSKWQDRQVLAAIQEKPLPAPVDPKPDRTVFRAFPTARRKAGSERFIPRGYLGVKGMGVAYEVCYEDGAKAWRLFVSVHSDDEAAATACRLLEAQPAVCVQAGPRVLGAIGLADEREAKKVVQALADKFRQDSKMGARDGE